MKGFTRIISLLMALSLSSALVSSCYDDTELKESIAGLEARVAALEEKMAENIAAVQSIISVGSIASWDFNAETGKGVITLLDGKTVEINQSIRGYSIITVEKGEDGVYYWAICKDGINLPLTIDNKKVPVTVTPALKISSENEWMISVDGGKTWVNTGISYYTGESSDEGSENQKPETPGDQDTPVVEAQVFEKAERDGDILVLTLVGGEQIRVQIVGEAVFKAAADTLWFSRAMMQKSVAVEMANVKAFTITEKPEGWKAIIEDESYLYITSPENFDEYPTQGTVKVLAVFENGATPEIMCVDVVYEPFFTLSRANEVVSVKMSEHTGEDFTGYVMAGWPVAEYSLEKAVEWLNMNAETLVPYEGNGTYSLDSIIENYSAIETYIVFAAPYLPVTQISQGKIRYEISDIASVETIAVTDAWEIKNLRYDSADLFAVLDVAEFYGGFFEAERWAAQAKEHTLENLKYGSLSLCTSVLYEGPVNGFPDGVIDGNLLPATTYVIWYVPVSADGEYTVDNFVENTFTTPDINSDAAVQAPSYVVSDITSSGFKAQVTPAASYYKTYAGIVKSTAIADMDEKAIATYLIGLDTYSEGTAVNVVESSSMSPDDEVYLIAVSITEDGGYGALVKEKVELKPLEYTDAIGVSVSSYECDEAGVATLNLEFTGSPDSLTFVVSSFMFHTDEVLQEFLALGQYGDAVTVSVADLGGKLVLSGLPTGEEQTFYAIVKDAEGNCSYLYTYTFTPMITIDYIMSDDPRYEFGMPKITCKVTSSQFKVGVTMPAECQKYWLFCGDSGYLPGDVLAQSDRLVNMQLELSGETVHTESVSMTYSSINADSRIYMVWQDVNGDYHAIYEFNPFAK